MATSYPRLVNRLNLDSLTAQTTCKTKVEMAIQLGDIVEIAIARTELSSLIIKKDQALIIRDRLKRMSSDAMNIDAEFVCRGTSVRGRLTYHQSHIAGLAM